MPNSDIQSDNNIYYLQINIPPAWEEDLELLLWDEVQTGWEEKENPDNSKDCIVYFDSREQAEALEERIRDLCPRVRCEVSSSVSQDWASEWRKYFRSIQVGEHFIVIPEWERDAARMSGHLHPVYIFPSMAFGTGNHPTTNLCLEAIGRLKKQGAISRGDEFLDIGTGSGILGIACAKLGLQGLGFDCDPDALINAKYNIALNNVQEEFRVFAGTLDNLKSSAGFDLVLANLYYRPLLWMASDLVGLVNCGGRLILSGILQEQEQEVVEAYQELGLQNPEYGRQNGWSAVIWNKNGDQGQL